MTPWASRVPRVLMTVGGEALRVRVGLLMATVFLWVPRPAYLPKQCVMCRLKKIQKYFSQAHYMSQWVGDNRGFI